MSYKYDVSIILPLYNCAEWLSECLSSVLNQTFNCSLELSIYNDSSTDNSISIVESFAESLKLNNINLVLTHSDFKCPRGCGFAKNRAIEASSGRYLCFLDGDDVMHKDRIAEQYKTALEHSGIALIGCKVWREPKGSTVRYTKWINSLTPEQLSLQIFTSNGPTLVMPTWFCHRSVFDLVGGFDEGGKGVPEDYIFFLRLCEMKCSFLRVDRPLLMYRHHGGCTTSSITEQTIWDIRLRALEHSVLCQWPFFTIWNAGKQGRKLYREMSPKLRQKVQCFCDVDTKKIALGCYVHELSSDAVKPKVPIVHFTQAPKPFVICVKLDIDRKSVV